MLLIIIGMTHICLNSVVIKWFEDVLQRKKYQTSISATHHITEDILKAKELQ